MYGTKMSLNLDKVKNKPKKEEVVGRNSQVEEPVSEPVQETPVEEVVEEETVEEEVEEVFEEEVVEEEVEEVVEETPKPKKSKLRNQWNLL